MNPSKLMEYVIVIAVFVLLVILFFSGSGGFAKVKSATSDTLGWFGKLLPNVGVGIDETKSSGVSLPVEENQQISALRRAVEAMKQSSKTDCVYNVEGFSNLKASSLSVQYDSTVDVTRFVVMGGAAGTQEITGSRFSLAGIQPCVIAGGEVTNLFEKRHFTSEGGMISYTSASSIRISQGKIVYDGISGGSLSGREWLYKPDATHICFFPSNGGLKSDYFESTTFENERLPACS